MVYDDNGSFPFPLVARKHDLCSRDTNRVARFEGMYAMTLLVVVRTMFEPRPVLLFSSLSGTI